ncbi:hypothetical protein BGZ98_005490, partial [Dissophora globulifera]
LPDVMKHKIEFTFTGDMKCRLLFCTVDEFFCGCDACKFWSKYETSTFNDDKNETFGHIEFKESSDTQTLDICSHHAMGMNLLPFDDTTSRNVKDLDLIVFGSDLGGTWSDSVVVDGHSCSIKIRVYDPSNPSKVTKTTNKLQLDFKGTKKCKMVFITAISCGCEGCKWWDQWTKGTFSDNSDFKYGAFYFETGPETRTYDLCPHHIMILNLTPFEDDTVRNAADLDVFISGDDVGGVWEDELEIGGEKNNITVKVYAADSVETPTQAYSPLAKKIRKLQFEYTDEPNRNYGVIFFESSPYTTTFDICSRLEMHMNLVAFLAESNKAKDLDVIVKGGVLNQTFKDTVDINGETNTVIVKVLKGPKAARAISEGSRVTNMMELNFMEKKKS